MFKNTKGVSYQGNYCQARLEGSGNISWKEKNTFRGYFKDGLANGEGVVSVKGMGSNFGFYEKGDLKYLDFEEFFKN